MNIAVIGIGAVGSIIARELKRLDHEITLFSRTEKQGFTIEEDGRATHYPYTIHGIDAPVRRPFDIIFIAAKATALEAISRKVPSMSHEGTEVVLCENGMGFDHYFDSPIPAVVYISGQKHEDRIEHFQDSRLLIEDRSHPYMDALIDSLDSDSGVKLEIEKSQNFRRTRYEKLLINLGINSVTALSHNTAKVFDLDSVEHLTRQLLEEGLAVINQEERLIDGSFIDHALSIYRSYNREMGTSMYYDVTSGARTEYAFIQKYFHDNKGPVETPVLDTIVTLLEAYQYER